MAKAKSIPKEPIQANPPIVDDSLEAAVSAIAEAQDTLGKEVQEIKKKVGSILVVPAESPPKVSLPVLNIDGHDFRFKFHSVIIGGKKITAQDLESDGALRISLFNEKPNLFVKI